MSSKNKRLFIILIFAFSIAFLFLSSLTASDAGGRLHDKVLTVDTHMDTPLSIFRDGIDLGIRHATGFGQKGDLDFPRMRDGGLDAAFFAVYLRQDTLSDDGYALAMQKADRILQVTKREIMRHQDMAEIALTPKDAYRIEKTGKRAVFFGLENGYAVGTDLANLRHFAEEGIRYVTLCHSRNNQICDASTDKGGPKWNGLSPFGRKVVAECNRLGLAIDVSHISDSAFYQVLRLTRSPVTASHSYCRALSDNPRNMTDDMLKTVARNNGTVQINLCSFYLIKENPSAQRKAALDSLDRVLGEWSSITDSVKLNEYETAYRRIDSSYPGTKASVADLADHIDHAVRVAGIDHVGIGSDFDGGAGLKDLRDVSEMPKITEELVRRGYSKEAVRKIWGGNIMRVLQENLDGAGK
jgi:membrane dipeptidase